MTVHSAHPQSKPTRFGMIGTGWMGRAIAPDFQLCDEVELVAIGSRDRDAGHAFAESAGVPQVMTVPQLINSDEIDIVYVATSNESHFELALAAIEAGRPVLVEKPFTTTAEEARILAQAADQRGVFAMEAMWMRFNPSILRMLDFVRSGAIGSPRTLLASFGFPVPQDGGRLWDPGRAGGSLLDQGVYPLALAQLLFGQPSSVSATGSQLDAAGRRAGVDTELAVLLGYPGGEQAILASSIRSMLPLSASIGGSEGLIQAAEAFWSDTAYTVRRPDGTQELVETHREGRGYVPMLRGVHEALRQGWLEHPLSPLSKSIALMETVDTVRSRLKSARIGA